MISSNVALLITIPILFLAGFISIILTYFRTGVVPMPSSSKERKVAQEIIETYGEGKAIVELGSGWGGFSRNLSKRFPGREITGLEISLFPYIVSKISQLILNSRVNFKRINFNNSKLQNNTIYIAYLSGSSMRELRKRFETDKPSGVLLISITFAMPGWTPHKTLYAPTIYNSPVYLYKLY